MLIFPRSSSPGHETRPSFRYQVQRQVSGPVRRRYCRQRVHQHCFDCKYQLACLPYVLADRTQWQHVDDAEKSSVQEKKIRVVYLAQGSAPAAVTPLKNGVNGASHSSVSLPPAIEDKANTSSLIPPRPPLQPTVHSARLPQKRHIHPIPAALLSETSRIPIRQLRSPRHRTSQPPSQRLSAMQFR